MAKRPHGSRTLFKRKDGRFEGRVLVGYINGKPKYKFVVRKTLKEAAAALETLRAQHTAGITLLLEQQTVQQFLHQWLSEVVAQRCRPTTYEMYSQSVRRITKHIGHLHLRTLSPPHVQTMLKQLGLEGYAPATIDRARDVLINALNQAVQWHMIPRNVAALTPPPKVEAYEARILTPTEAQQLLHAARGDRLEALWRVGLSLGLRRGEVLGLRWQDIDVDNGTLRIAVNLQRIGGTLALVKPKTKESERTLPLPASLIPVLRQHRIAQEHEQRMAGGHWQDHGLVFCTHRGTPMAPRNLLRSLHTLLDRAHLPRMRFHDLRHSCATLLLTQGVPVKVVQDLLGHTDARVTLGIYQHVVMDDRRRAAATMDTLLTAPHDDHGAHERTNEKDLQVQEE